MTPMVGHDELGIGLSSVLAHIESGVVPFGLAILCVLKLSTFFSVIMAERSQERRIVPRTRWHSMTGDEYRRKAMQAENRAAASPDADMKACYRDIAAHWRLLADQREGCSRWLSPTFLRARMRGADVARGFRGFQGSSEATGRYGRFRLCLW
jgi:hypothetical protein